MPSGFLQFVQANLTALQAIFGWLTTCIGGLYVLYKFLLERREMHPHGARDIGLARRDDQPARDRIENRPRRPLRRLATRSSSIMLVVACVSIIGGLMIALPITYDSLTTVTVEYKVCMGEYERGCDFPHDDRIYCAVPIADWANPRCLRWSAVTIGSHDGNKCGYANIAVSCTKRRP
jgi:hypothetical protein